MPSDSAVLTQRWCRKSLPPRLWCRRGGGQVRRMVVARMARVQEHRQTTRPAAGSPRPLTHEDILAHLPSEAEPLLDEQ